MSAMKKTSLILIILCVFTVAATTQVFCPSFKVRIGVSPDQKVGLFINNNNVDGQFDLTYSITTENVTSGDYTQGGPYITYTAQVINGTIMLPYMHPDLEKSIRSNGIFNVVYFDDIKKDDKSFSNCKIKNVLYNYDGKKLMKAFYFFRAETVK